MKLDFKHDLYRYQKPIYVRGEWFNECVSFKVIQDQKIIYETLFTPRIKNIDPNQLITSFHHFFDKQLIMPEPEIDFILNSFQKRLDSPKAININFLEEMSDDLTTGYLKIKLTNERLKDQNFLNLLKNKFHNPKILKLRFDGNRLLERDLFYQFLNDLTSEEREKIDYIEEPLKTLVESKSVLDFFKIKLGIDESITEFLALDSNDFKNSIVVLKPSIFGYTQSMELIQALKHKQISVIISSLYDSQFDLKTLMSLANYSDQINQETQFHGLDTLKYLSTDSSQLKIRNHQLLLF